MAYGDTAPGEGRTVNASTISNDDAAVLTCAATECAYNEQFACHAPDIIIGRDYPACEMYTHGTVLAGLYDPMVALCMSTMCEFNDGYHCRARGVTLDQGGDHAACATFRT